MRFHSRSRCYRFLSTVGKQRLSTNATVLTDDANSRYKSEAAAALMCSSFLATLRMLRFSIFPIGQTLRSRAPLPYTTWPTEPRSMRYLSCPSVKSILEHASKIVRVMLQGRNEGRPAPAAVFTSPVVLIAVHPETRRHLRNGGEVEFVHALTLKPKVRLTD